MRLVRCGSFALVLVVGTQLHCISSWCSSYLSVATTFSIILSLIALITWVGLRLADWMVLEKRRRIVERNVLSALQLSARIELPIGSTRAGDLS